MGFPDITVVDLDTVDLSNLNRQFLFRQKHIGMPKSTVATETALKFNPHIKITSHLANIMNTKLFPLKWFKGFDIICNALDNKEARAYVNKLAILGKIPLIESGTMGYNGQTHPIVGLGDCYSCTPKAVNKSFAVCTIRSTPSLPIHCVVWSKDYLFSQLFDQKEDVIGSGEQGDNPEELAKLQTQSNELGLLREKSSDPEFANLVFDKCFVTDILALQSMRTTQKPLNLISREDVQKDIVDIKELAIKALSSSQRVWSVQEAFAVFVDATQRLQARFTEDNTLSFDKDDEDTLDFVVASTILRSHIFSIEQKSKFEIKQIAGNIIPAIATSNAMIAGLCVLQAIQTLTAIKTGTLKSSSIPAIYTSSQNTLVFSSGQLDANPECLVCQASQVSLRVDPAVTKLRYIVENLIQEQWDYPHEFSITSDALIYDVDFDDNLDRTLADLGVEPESFLTIMDDGDEPIYNNISLYIESLDVPDKQTGDQALEVIRKSKVDLKKKDLHLEPEQQDVDMSMIIASDTLNESKKRRADDSAEDEPSHKRPKEMADEDNSIIILDDSDEEDGLIEID